MAVGQKAINDIFSSLLPPALVGVMCLLGRVIHTDCVSEGVWVFGCLALISYWFLHFLFAVITGYESTRRCNRISQVPVSLSIQPYCSSNPGPRGNQTPWPLEYSDFFHCLLGHWQFQSDHVVNWSLKFSAVLACSLVETKPSKNQRSLAWEPNMVGRLEVTQALKSLCSRGRLLVFKMTRKILKATLIFARGRVLISLHRYFFPSFID